MHALIASEVASESEEGRRLLERANKWVDRWESDNLCSAEYVKIWRRILKRPDRMKHVTERDGGLVKSLMQNSPFGFAFKGLARV